MPVPLPTGFARWDFGGDDDDDGIAKAFGRVVTNCSVCHLFAGLLGGPCTPFAACLCCGTGLARSGEHGGSASLWAGRSPPESSW